MQRNGSVRTITDGYKHTLNAYLHGIENSGLFKKSLDRLSGVHPKLVEVGGGINPETMELELPYSHLEALLYFVASRVHNPMGMANEFHAGNSWAAKYEAECMKLQQQNLEIDESNDSDRISRNGWV